MLEDKTIITVTNRNNGSTGYSIPEMNGLKRRFAPGESKKITMDELRKLSYKPGGDYLLKNYYLGAQRVIKVYAKILLWSKLPI